MLMVCC